MRLLTWNTCAGGGSRRRPLQLDAIFRLKPDLLALQEVTANSIAAYYDGLQDAGLSYIVDSFALAPSQRRLTGPRRYGQITASRWPLTAMPPQEFRIPWRERVLSCVVDVPSLGRVEIHNTHVPPGSSNGWTKIRHLEGIYRRLGTSSPTPRILVGDFNTPKLEKADGAVETWGGEPHAENRWDLGERNVMTGLVHHGLVDVFRTLHGYKSPAYSIVVSGTRRRYDHVFASAALRPSSADYLHTYRETKLSDHAPLLVEFARGDSRAAHSGGEHPPHGP